MSHDRHYRHVRAYLFNFAIHKSYIVVYGLFDVNINYNPIAISGALLKYFGESSATGQPPPPVHRTLLELSLPFRMSYHLCPQLFTCLHKYLILIMKTSLPVLLPSMSLQVGFCMYLCLSLSLCVRVRVTQCV